MIKGEEEIKSHVTDFCEKLYCNRSEGLLLEVRKVEVKAKELINKLNGVAISGCSPKGIAGALMYIASVLIECRLTQSEIARVSEVTENTIRNRYIELCKVLNVTRIVRGKSHVFIREK